MVELLLKTFAADRHAGYRHEAIAKYAAIGMLVAVATLLLPHHPGHHPVRFLFALVLALAAGGVALAWPLLDPGESARPMARLVAFVGCDGSGKSTLSVDMLAELRRSSAVELCYLGLGSGAIGQRIARLPVIGCSVERRLARKAAQSRTRGQKIPGPATAIVIYGFSLLRLQRFRRMVALRRRGVPVLTDRYPQTEIPGFYDGPGLSAARTDSPLIAFLARRELRIYEWMAGFRPDVVIRLNVDLDTAHARKPDHRYEMLREKVRVTPLLRFAGAPIRDLDSAQPYEMVRSTARLVIRDALDPGYRAAA